MSPSRSNAILALVFGLVSVVQAAASTTSPGFYWLPPTVPRAATPTGAFDATALDDLAVEICELDRAGGCVAGPPIERLTSKGRPIGSRIRLEPYRQSYTVDWKSRRSDVSRKLFYRVRVLRAATELGTIDVDIVRNWRQLEKVDTSKYIGLIEGEPLTIRFRIQRPTARTSVTLNEVESNGGVPGDWIELYNAAAVPVSLAGYVIQDNDDTHLYTLPAGTRIPARGYYVIEESELGFGLGGADAVRLSTRKGVIVDSYEWAAHAATTYGRCPDGAGAFQTTTTVTKGAANDCGIVIRINEVESNGGTPGDWVELYNPGPGLADLSGFRFQDNDDTHNFDLPALVVPAGGYLLLEEADLGFGLGSADSARLFRPDGSLADAYAWTAHAATTYGRCPNGTGDFVTTAASTKGGTNSCAVAVTTVHINEVESSGGDPGDWIEIINTGTTDADLSGWLIRDNDDTHDYFLPAGTLVAAGGYLVVEEAGLGYGLGAAESVRLYDPSGSLFESYSWTTHAATTYGRCPDGTGEFTTTASVTKGGPNDCGRARITININEVESSDGSPGDWVELYNPGGSPVDLSNFAVRDNDDSHTFTGPAGTTLASGEYIVIDEADLGFGLGGADSIRLFDQTGALLDSYAWTAHAPTTYGRCPNGTSAFVTTTAPTRGGANACPGGPQPWPGDAAVQTADGANVFGGNMSGLIYEGSGDSTPGVLWAVRNGPGMLFRLVWNGSIWTPDADTGWGAGKVLHYADATGNTDAEGVTFAESGAAGGIYVSTERNNDVNAISRNSILRFDPASADSSLAATHEWNITADLPVTGANTGIEGITWIPDSFLVSRGFADESKGANYAYNPADYPDHGAGLFFVGVEANGQIYAYALDHSGGSFTRVATISSGFTGVMDLQFDRELEQLWAVCDDTCLGQTAVLRIAAGTGAFAVAERFERPAGMPNLNNEGFAFAPLAECNMNVRPAFWSDDSETDGHAMRSGTLACTAF